MRTCARSGCSSPAAAILTYDRGGNFAAQFMKRDRSTAPAVATARTHSGPVVVDFRTDENEKVFPMVPAGASNTDIVVGISDRSTR